MRALEARPRRQEGIIAQQAHGRTVLLRLDDGSYYTLEDVGARIWDLCDGEHSVEQMAAILCTEFDAPAESVQVDVLEFVSELRDERLLADAH